MPTTIEQRSVVPAHNYGPGFDRAVQTALDHLDIERSLVRPECLVGFAVCEHTSPSDQHVSYRVLSADAWERPNATPLLPWSAPSDAYRVVAQVLVDGSVAMTDHVTLSECAA